MAFKTNGQYSNHVGIKSKIQTLTSFSKTNDPCSAKLTIFDQNHKVKYHLVHDEAKTVKNEVHGGAVTLDLVISSILLPLLNHGWSQ